MCVDCNDPIVAWVSVDQIAPIESDLKLAKVNAFQFNRFGRNGNRLLRMVPGDFLELVVQGEHVVIDVLNRSDGSMATVVGI
jgi:hypothetical protein